MDDLLQLGEDTLWKILLWKNAIANFPDSLSLAKEKILDQTTLEK